MKENRFNDLLAGMKISSNLDYHKAKKFTDAFAKAILENDMTIEQMSAVYDAIPYKETLLCDICENKEKLFSALSEKPLDDKAYKSVLNFMINCIASAKDRACLASYFVKASFVSKKNGYTYDHLHAKYEKHFWTFINGKFLTSKLLTNINGGSSSVLTLEQLEMLCKFAEEADHEGLGCILKAIYADIYDDWPVDPLYELEKTLKARQLLSRLFLKLCEYEPMPWPGEDKYKESGYDFKKRFSVGAIQLIKNMEKAGKGFLTPSENYDDLKAKVSEAYLKGGGSILSVAKNFYGMQWYIKKTIEGVKAGNKLESFDSIDARKLEGKIDVNDMLEFVEVFLTNLPKEPKSVFRFIIHSVTRLPELEGVKLFAKFFKLYSSIISWRTFADMLLVRGDYDDICISAKEVKIAKIAQVWQLIVNEIIKVSSYSGNDFEYMVRIYDRLDFFQKKSIKKRLANCTLIEGFSAWNKLYDVVKKYGVDKGQYPADVLEKFRDMELADKF